jgi:hypothetical protein
MENAGRLLRIGLERREERRRVALLHPAQDRHVQLGVVLLAEEHAPEDAAAFGRHFLGGQVGDEIKVELRAQFGDFLTKQRPALAFQQALDSFLLEALEKAAEQVERVLGLERKAVSNDAGLQIEIE